MQDAKIEVIATEQDEGVVYLKHSWENQFAHIFREDGTLRRCFVGRIVLTKDSEVAIGVRFFQPAPETNIPCQMQKSVCPLLLLIANQEWLRSNVVSESEGDGEGYEGREYDEQNPRASALPWFQYEEPPKRLDKQQRRKLKWMTVQVHGAQNALKAVAQQKKGGSKKKTKTHKVPPFLSVCAWVCFLFWLRRTRRIKIGMSVGVMMVAKEKEIDKTQMSTVTAGVWNDQHVIFKRNFKNRMSTEALENEIMIYNFLSKTLPSNNGVIMQMLESSSKVDSRGHKMLEIVQERGQEDVFNFSRTLPVSERFEFTQTLMTRLLSHLRTLHTCNVAHCDIKPENMVIRDLKRPAESIALIDFGFACVLPADVDAHVYAGRGLWLDNGAFGTFFYRHPNLLERKPTDLFMADLYACGMVCFTMFANSSPYSQDDENTRLALAVHNSFVDGTWKSRICVKKHVKEHPRMRQWCDFIDQLCSGTHKCVSDKLLNHAFLKI